MKIKENLVAVLFFFFFPLAVIYMLSTGLKELFGASQKWRTYLGLLICWAMLRMPVVAVYRLIKGAL